MTVDHNHLLETLMKVLLIQQLFGRTTVKQLSNHATIIDTMVELMSALEVTTSGEHSDNKKFIQEPTDLSSVVRSGLLTLGMENISLLR
jgi:hypothetical protein